MTTTRSGSRAPHHVQEREEWGFACGEIGPARQSKANFSVSYEGGWKEVGGAHSREGHLWHRRVRLVGAPAGRGDVGASARRLRKGQVPLVRHAEGDVWKPASELLFHNIAQMEAARSAAQVSK